MAESNIQAEKGRLGRHAGFWLAWMGGFTVLQSFGYGIDDYGAWAMYYLLTLPLFMAHTYAIAYWLVPKFFFRHRYLTFSMLIVFLLVLVSVFELIISNELIWRVVKPENIQQGNYLDWQNVLINGLGNEYIVTVFLSVKVVRFWNSKMGEKAELVNLKLSAEIVLLQNQSYPLFILNLVERLEELAGRKSPKTPEMLIRLSTLMSNLTAAWKSGEILLNKEIELIRSYIDIQRMSFPEGRNVNLMVSGDLNGIQIPPFLFFQVVEEGFAVLGDSQAKTDYTILIKTEPHYLLFSLTLWTDQVLGKPFNSAVIENCSKYLAYFYPESHKVMSNFEINFVEMIIEIYL
jgi:hypothetical protein